MAKRKAHVVRFGGRNWVDVLRIDELPVNFQSTAYGKQGQLIKFKLYWADRKDPNTGAFPDPNTARKTSSYPVPDPTKDPDKSSGTSFDIIEKMKITMPEGAETGRRGQTVAYKFDNAVPGNKDDKPIGKRKVKIYKIYSNDLGDTDGKRGSQVYDGVDWDTYKEWLADSNAYINRSTYLPVEFPDSFTVSFGADASNGWQGQDIKFTLSNKEIVKILKLGDPIENMSDPYTEGLVRTDPLQVIINHGFTASCGVDIIFTEELYTFCSPATDNGPASVNTMVWIPSMPFYTFPGFYIFEDGPGKKASDTLLKQNVWADGKIHVAQTCTMYGEGDMKPRFFNPDNKEMTGMVSMSPNTWTAVPWQYRISGGNRPDFNPFSPEEVGAGQLQGPDGPVVINRFPGDPKPYLVMASLSWPFGQYGNSIGGPALQWLGGFPPGYVSPPATIPGGDAYAYYPLWPKETDHVFSYGGADDIYGVELSQGTQTETPRISGGKVTVSGNTFKCGGKTYQVKGIIVDPKTKKPPGGGYNAGFYCERVDPDS